jgi:hypothetical protein
MLNSPTPHTKETSGCWSKANKNFFRMKISQGQIDINNTTPAYIKTIRLKHWGSKTTSPSTPTIGTQPLIFCASNRLQANKKQVSHLLCFFHLDTSRLDALETATAPTTTEKDVNVNNNNNATNINDKEGLTTMAKKDFADAASKKPAMTSGSGVDDLTDHLQLASVSTHAKKGPAYYSFTLRDAYILQSFRKDATQFIEVDLYVEAGGLTLTK